MGNSKNDQVAATIISREECKAYWDEIINSGDGDDYLEAGKRSTTLMAQDIAEHFGLTTPGGDSSKEKQLLAWAVSYEWPVPIAEASLTHDDEGPELEEDTKVE